VVEFIEENLADDISLATLARLVDLSLSTLHAPSHNPSARHRHRYHMTEESIVPGAFCRARPSQ